METAYPLPTLIELITIWIAWITGAYLMARLIKRRQVHDTNK